VWEVGRYGCQNDGLDEADTMGRTTREGGSMNGRKGGRREGGREGGTCLGSSDDVGLILSVEGTNGETLHGQVPAEGGREEGHDRIENSVQKNICF